MTMLPYEIILFIFSYFDAKELCLISQVSFIWNYLGTLRE